MDNKFETILDECLDRILLNGETVEQCLLSYPEYADELKPLLETTVAASQATAIQPRPEFRERAKYQFVAAAREMEEKKSRSMFNWSWQPRYAMTALTIALVILLSGGGTVAAAAGSMPDEALYPVKLATEQARIAFTFSELGKTELYADLADERVDEIVYLAGGDDAGKIEDTANRLNNHLVAMTNAGTASTGWFGISAATTSEDMEMGAAQEGEILTIESAEQNEEEIIEEETATAIEEEGLLTSPVPEKADAAEEEEYAAAQEFPERQIIEVPEAAGAGNIQVEQFAANADGSPDPQIQLNVQIANQSVSNSARLQSVLDIVPESAKPALVKAINNLEFSYINAVNNLSIPSNRP